VIGSAACRMELPPCPTCDEAQTAPCYHCGGLACDRCDYCHGCGHVICHCCNTTPTPQFSYPGDRDPHPHIETR
jgi:hypothetical protein